MRSRRQPWFAPHPGDPVLPWHLPPEPHYRLSRRRKKRMKKGKWLFRVFLHGLVKASA